MADNKPSTNYYQNLGGINNKASLYELSVAQFLNLRNVDFDVPNALQKRPGSSLFSSQSLSGPVLGLYEYQKLLTSGQTASNFILANANGNVFFNTPSGASYPTTFTLLSQNYGATQPVDFLTFANKLWMANGTKWESWTGATLSAAGLPMAVASTGLSLGNYIFNAGQFASSSGSYCLVNGATMFFKVTGATMIIRSMYLAYTYNRTDGYGGPVDFQATARNIITSSPGNGNEFFQQSNFTRIGGFTTPPGLGITSISLWLAEDTIYSGGSKENFENIPGVGDRPTGDLGWLDETGAFIKGSLTLKPDASLDRFWLFTTVPVSSFFGYTTITTSEYVQAITFIPAQSFIFYDGLPQPGFAFSAISFNFFGSFIPKYQDLNLNRMFISGFSSLPSGFAWSEVGAPETYSEDAFAEARTNDGDKILAQTSFNNQMLFMKENSFHKLIGDSTDNFQLVQISDEYGCLSNKSVVQYNDICLWLDKKGILEYTGASPRILSTPVEGIFKRMNVSAALEYAVGVHHKYRNQIWWGIPVDGSSVNNLTVVYDYLVGAWTFFDGFNPSAFSFIKGQLTRPTAWRGDYTGFVHFTGESFYNDSGQGISCVALTRFEAAGENNTFIWRRFFLDVATSSGLTGVINGKVFANYDQSTVQATFRVFQDAFQSRAEMGVVGKAVACEVGHHSASLPLLINGYSWTKRGLRNL